MIKSKLIKIINLFVIYCYLTIVFLIPIFFSFFIKTNNVFELNKIIIFKILTHLLFLFSLLKIILYKDERVHFLNLKNYFWRNRFLIFVLLFFTLSLAFSTFLAANRDNSLFGLYDRQEGLNSYLYYLLYFFLTLFNIRTKRQIENIIKTLVVSSLLVCVYGLIQAAGHDFFSWIESTRIRTTSTFGQPNILSAYLLLVYPFTIYLVFNSKNFFKRAFYLFVFVMQVINLFFTYSISGWLGFAFGIFILAIIFFKNESSVISKFFKKDIFKKIIFFIFIISVLFLTTSGIYNKHTLKNKINSIFNPQAGSFAARIDFWQASISAVRERPFFGWGLENQEDLISRYYSSDWAIHSSVNVRPNRAHNLFLDILLTRGFFGLFSYLFLLYLFFRSISENIKNNYSKYLNYSILISLTGYLTSLLFNFTFVVGNIYFWLFFALVLLISKNKDFSVEIVEEDVGSPQKTIIFRLILIFLAVLALIPFFYFINKQIKLLIADYYFLEIRQSRMDNEYFRSLTLFNYLKDLKIRDKYYMTQYAQMVTDWFPELDKYGSVFRYAAENNLNEIVAEINGNSLNDYFARAKIYSFLASNDKNDYYQKSQDNFDYLIKNYQNVPLYYYEMAKMQNKKGDYDTAISNFLISLEKLPSLENPYLNRDHKNDIEKFMFLNYLGFGDVYLSKKNYEISFDYYNKAKDINAKNTLIYEKFSNYSKIKGDFEEAVEYNKKALEIWPNNYFYLFEIAKIYKEIGDFEKAREYAQKALDLSLENLAIKNFLNTLK